MMDSSGDRGLAESMQQGISYIIIYPYQIVQYQQVKNPVLR